MLHNTSWKRCRTQKEKKDGQTDRLLLDNACMGPLNVREGSRFLNPSSHRKAFHSFFTGWMHDNKLSTFRRINIHTHTHAAQAKCKVALNNEQEPFVSYE